MAIGIARLAGFIWLAYFGLSVSGDRLKILPLQLVGNAVYFVFAFALYRYFADGDPVIALALLPLAAAGGVIQTIGMVQRDRGKQRLAFGVFGLFLATVGILILRSGAAPQLLGQVLLIAAVGSVGLLIPRAPLVITLLSMLTMFGEGALVLWLLVAG